MTFIEFATKLITDQMTDFPSVIYAPPETTGFLGTHNLFWDKIRTLRKYTDVATARFSDAHQGSTGWEYEMMMALVDKKFYYSIPTTSRNYTEVQSSHNVRFEPKLDSKNMILNVTVSIDGKVVSTKSVRGLEAVNKRIAEINQINSGTSDIHTSKPAFICHLHSHPQVQIGNSGKRIYTFFSPQDLDSLTHNSIPLMGLVTDRLWLLAKPKEGSIPTAQELHGITSIELTDPANLENTAGQLMHKYGMKLYVGGFGNLLKLLS